MFIFFRLDEETLKVMVSFSSAEHSLDILLHLMYLIPSSDFSTFPLEEATFITIIC